MTSSDYSWLQLPTSTQWEELAFDSTYNSQGSSLSSPTYDNALYTGTLNTPPSLSTTPPTPNNSTTQNPISQRSYRQRRTPQPRSESSTTGSTYQGNSHGPISQRPKSQNRASQHAFRQRRTEHFQALQSRVAGLEKQLHAAKVLNRLLAQVNGLKSLSELRGRMAGGGVGMGVRRGRGGDRETCEGGLTREPPACKDVAGFRTCDLPLLGMGMEGGYWDASVLGEGFEADVRDVGDWQAVAMGDGETLEASPFGGVPDGAGWM